MEFTLTRYKYNIITFKFNTDEYVLFIGAYEDQELLENKTKNLKNNEDLKYLINKSSVVLKNNVAIKNWYEWCLDE